MNFKSRLKMLKTKTFALACALALATTEARRSLEDGVFDVPADFIDDEIDDDKPKTIPS